MIYSRKTGKYLNRNFFTGSWPGIVWTKNICQILIQPLLTFDPALFPGKNIPNIAKSNRIFPGKGRGDKGFTMTYLDSSVAEVFPNYLLFFSILAIFRRKRGVKAELNVLKLGPVLFHKYSNPSKIFQTVLLFAGVLSAVLDHIGAVRAQNLPKRAISWMLSRYAKLWKFLT